MAAAIACSARGSPVAERVATVDDRAQEVAEGIVEPVVQ
jgi:hypothetical protein